MLGAVHILRKQKKPGGWVGLRSLMLTVGLVGGLKNSEMLTDAYGGVGGWVKKLGNAYRCLRWNK